MSLSEPMPLATPFLPRLHNDPPCGSLWPAALQHSALLHFAQLCFRKATSSLSSSSPLFLLSPLTVHSLEGVETPGLDTPHRGPRAQLVGRSHGRTQDPGALRWAVCQGPSQPPQGQCQPERQLLWGP